MPTNLKRFKSDNGFESPGFVVDASGNVVTKAFRATSVSTTSLDIDNLFIDGNLLFTGSGTVLGSAITTSSLESVGTLNSLDVNGLTTLRYNSTTVLQVIDDKIIITSPQRGSINNVDIGTVTPGTVKATRLDLVASGGSQGQLNASNSSINLNNTVIDGDILFNTPIRVGARPVLGDQVARKDYVDNSVVAYAVALGI